MSDCWTNEKITDFFNKPLLDLVYEAATIHRQNHNSRQIQISTLYSVKTGGCQEDCSYCAQSSKYSTKLMPRRQFDLSAIIQTAKRAKENGVTRFCIGAAQRQVSSNKEFEVILQMVREISQLGLEVCCTLGMLTYNQAQMLADAGLHTYNHNIDTSPEYYDRIVTSHTFEERLATLENIRKANLNVCCGIIIGMGESKQDKIRMIQTLVSMPKSPESVPINALVPIPGTPLENLPRVPWWEIARVISVVRITMPRTIIRISAGRAEMNTAEQAVCFMAGANSIFVGEKMLTTPAPKIDDDKNMLELLGLNIKPIH